MVEEPPPPMPSQLLKTFRAMRPYLAIAVVFAVLVLLVLGGLVVWGLVYDSQSYTSYHQAQLQFRRDPILVWVVLNFDADGPISAGQPLHLRGIQMLGVFPPGISRIYFRIIVPGVYPIWPEFNQSVAEPDPSFGYLWASTGYGIYRQQGTFNITGLLELWVGPSLVYSNAFPEDISSPKLTVQSADSWSQYSARRWTTAAAVLSLLFASVPLGFKNSFELLKPFSQWVVAQHPSFKAIRELGGKLGTRIRRGRRQS